MKVFTFLCAIAFLSSCTVSSELSGGDKLDRSYTIAGGSFDEGGTIVIAAKARNANGQLEICGARIQSKIASTAPNADDNVVEASRIEVDGSTVMQDLSAFNKVSMTNNVNGQPTTCLRFDRPWSSDTDNVITVNVPFLQMRFDRENITTFFPGPVAQVIGEKPPTAAELAAAAEAEKAREANKTPAATLEDMEER